MSQRDAEFNQGPRPVLHPAPAAEEGQGIKGGRGGAQERNGEHTARDDGNVWLEDPKSVPLYRWLWNGDTFRFRFPYGQPRQPSYAHQS